MLNAFSLHIHRTVSGNVILDISLRKNPCSWQETLVRDNDKWGKDFLSWCYTWQSFTFHITTPSTFLCVMYMAKTPFISSSRTKSCQDCSGKPRVDTGKTEPLYLLTWGNLIYFHEYLKKYKNAFSLHVKICQMTGWSGFKFWQSS